MKNERYILGAMLQWEDPLLLGLSRITEDDFVSIERRHIFGFIKSLHAKKIKPSIQLIGTLLSDEELSIEAMQCIEQAPTSSGLETHIQILEKRTAKRRLKEILTAGLAEIADEDLDKNIIGEVQTKVNALALESIKAKEYEHGQSVTDWLVDLTAVKKKIGSMRTPWNRMNKILNGGLYKGKTYVIGGLKKTGKSRISCHLTAGLLEDEQGVVWYSMEMPAADIHTCVLASEAIVNTASIHRGQLSDLEVSALNVYAGSYMNRDLYIFKNSSINPDFVAAGIRSRKQKQRVDVVFIDYVQRMKSPSKKANRADELELIMNAVSDIARDENVAIVLLSQMSNETEKKDTNTPAYGKFKGSGAILEAADVGIVLTDINRGHSSPEGQDWRDIDAIIVQRAGESDVTVQFKAMLQFSKFVETEREVLPPATKQKRSSF